MADDNKNPLDVLEELLKDKSGGAGSGDDKKENEEDEKAKEEKAAEAELEQKRQEYEQKQKEQAVIDEQKLVEHKQAIVGIRDSKEYKAKVDQEAEKKIEIEKKTVASDGFEIDQLGHTKV